MPLLKKYWLQIAAHIGSLAPFALLIWDFLHDNLTVNPIQEITFRTGTYALTLLVLSLACTPVNALLGWKRVMVLRRPLGLYAFFYAALHLMTFVGLDYGFDWGQIWSEIAEKRYIVAGFSAFMLLLPLAITSTKGWMRRLGRGWRRMHRLVYLAAILAIVHYVWLVKADISRPVLYGLALAALLALRSPRVRGLFRGGAARPKAPTAAPSERALPE